MLMYDRSTPGDSPVGRKFGGLVAGDYRCARILLEMLAVVAGGQTDAGEGLQAKVCSFIATVVHVPFRTKAVYARQYAPMGVEAISRSQIKNNAAPRQAVGRGNGSRSQADALVACGIAAGIKKPIFVTGPHRERVHAAGAFAGRVGGGRQNRIGGIALPIKRGQHARI